MRERVDRVSDIMRSAHGQKVNLMPGRLNKREVAVIEVRGEWEDA